MFDKVISGGESTCPEDQLVPIFRNGKIAEAYWTISYSALYDKSRKIAGILLTCSETAGKITLVSDPEETNQFSKSPSGFRADGSFAGYVSSSGELTQQVNALKRQRRLSRN